LRYTLRPYQKEAVEKSIAFFNSDNKKDAGLIVAPTASGKALMVANTAMNVRGSSIILQPSKEILEQNMSKLHNYGYNELGVFSAGMGRKDINKITLGTIGTVKNAMEEFKLFDNVIIDECHLCNAMEGMYKDFITYLDNVKVLGYTATPFRMHYTMDGAICKMLTRTSPKIFKKLIYNISMDEMYAGGYLADAVYEEHSYDASKLKLNSNLSNYDEDSLVKVNKLNNILDKAVDCIKNHKDRKHFLVFTVSVQEAHDLRNMLNKIGYRFEVVSAKTDDKDRKIYLNNFSAGYLDGIINVGTLTTGYDFPELDCIVVARKTLSLPLWIQIVGRGLRIAKGKKNCLIVDLVGNTAQFGKPETMKLVSHYEDYRYRWYSEEKGFLTGVYIHNGYDIEDHNYQLSKGKANFFEKKEDAPMYIIPFGKFKGQLLSRVPVWYVKWCCDNITEHSKNAIFRNELDVGNEII